MVFRYYKREPTHSFLSNCFKNTIVVKVSGIMYKIKNTEESKMQNYVYGKYYNNSYA